MTMESTQPQDVTSYWEEINYKRTMFTILRRDDTRYGMVVVFQMCIPPNRKIILPNPVGKVTMYVIRKKIFRKISSKNI